MGDGYSRITQPINSTIKMGLLLNQVLDQLKSPKKKAIISKAIRHEQRLKFHTETYLEASEISQPLTVFLDWVKTLIPKDKYNIFVSLFQYPTPIVELTSRIYNELERVFDGRNSAVNFQFNDSTLRDDWEYYRQDILKEPDIWKHKGWQKMKTAINAVLIVDLPVKQSSSRPEPYFYWLDIDHVIDFGFKGKTIDWIIFRQGENRIAAFDDEYFRVFDLDKKNEIVRNSLIETKHDLGYCPATFFWSTELSTKFPELKKAPISSQLANLDWLLFFSVSKRHLDLYAPYPIYSAYASDCSFANNETGDYCDGGFLRDKSQNYKMYRDGTVERCPVCSEKRIAGVGSFIEIPVPNGVDSPDMRDPVQITTIDKESLQYNVDEVNRLKAEIYSSVVGEGGEAIKKQGVNEMQVSANFDDKTTILNGLKVNYERAQKFVDDTICKLRYGDQFLSSSINLGTEFYIYTVDDLYAQYKQAKENGASESQLDSITDQIISTENRNNPLQMQRMLILKQLEPYRHNTRDELITLNDKNLIDTELLNIKINFSTFVDRFERENTNIIEFGSLLAFDKKIETILNVFKSYVSKRDQQPGKITG